MQSLPHKGEALVMQLLCEQRKDQSKENAAPVPMREDTCSDGLPSGWHDPGSRIRTQRILLHTRRSAATGLAEAGE